jgi:hypothetical protein
MLKKIPSFYRRLLLYIGVVCLALIFLKEVPDRLSSLIHHSKSVLQCSAGTLNGTKCIEKKEFSNGDRYEGELQYGEFQGQGTYFFANGDKYVGGFNHASGIDGQLVRATGETQRALLRRTGLEEWEIILVEKPDCVDGAGTSGNYEELLVNCYAVLDDPMGEPGSGTRYYGEFGEDRWNGASAYIGLIGSQRVGVDVTKYHDDAAIQTYTTCDLKMVIRNGAPELEQSYIGKIDGGTIRWTESSESEKDWEWDSRACVKDNFSFIKPADGVMYILVWGSLVLTFIVLTVILIFKLLFDIVLRAVRTVRR